MRVRTEKLVRLVHDEQRAPRRHADVENLDAREARGCRDVPPVRLALEQLVGREPGHRRERAREARLAGAGHAVKEDVEPPAVPARGQHLAEHRAVIGGELPVELPRKRLRLVRMVVARVEGHRLHALEIPAQLLEIEIVSLVNAVIAEEAPVPGQRRSHLAKGTVDGHREVERTVRHRNVLRKVVERRGVQDVDELQHIRLHGVEPEEPAQATEAALETDILLARDQLAQDAVAQNLQHRPTALAQRFPVPDAPQHEPHAVAVQLKLLLLRVGQTLQVLRVNVPADDGGNLVTLQVVGDDVEEVRVINLLIEVSDRVQPEFQRPLHRGSSCHILISCHDSRSRTIGRHGPKLSWKAESMPTALSDIRVSADIFHFAAKNAQVAKNSENFARFAVFGVQTYGTRKLYRRYKSR